MLIRMEKFVVIRVSVLQEEWTVRKTCDVKLTDMLNVGCMHVVQE
jgi:hypothetical protein